MIADLQLLFRKLVYLVSAAQHARHVGAHLHVILSGRLAPDHRIIGKCFVDLQLVEIQTPRDFGDQRIADIPQQVLPVQRHGHQRRTLDRIPREQRLVSLFEFRGQLHQRSTSPSTMSIVPMHAIKSATSRPSASLGNACRFTNEGARTCTRYGLGEPSLATKKPSSPRGDSIRWYTSPAGGENPSVKILKW